VLVSFHTVLSFRVYPSEAQLQRLKRWEGTCRFLWNLAHEQRLRGLGRPYGDPKKFYSAAEQRREFTALRAEVDWIDDLPRHVGAVIFDRLDEAWRKFFSKKGGMPSFKKAGVHAISLEEFDPKVWRLDFKKSLIRFPKIGNLPVVLHRDLPGKAISCELVRDVDRWFAHITFEVETQDAAPTGGPIAIDVGVEVAFADSSGDLVPNPRFGDALAPTLAKRQRQLAKKQKGSNNRKKEKVKVAKVHRKLRRQRENFLHTWSHRYAKNHSVVVIEDLKLKNMTRSAKGTVEESGRNVAQKAGLNRALLDVAPGRFASMLEYKTARRGGLLVRVPAAYSSQECAECGHVASENRPSRSEFRCVSCGHEAHADTNAAKVLLKRSTRRTGGEAACGGTLEAGPMKQEPKPARARTKATKTRAKSLGLQAEDGLRLFPGPGSAPRRRWQPGAAPGPR
jgi:putative transposase